MGFRFSSFVAGAAENITETLKEDEKQAAVAATYGVKALKEQYDKVQILRILGKAPGPLDNPDDGQKPSVIGVNIQAPEDIEELNGE